MNVRCLLIDDEPPARELLASYISKLDDFEIAAQFGSAIEAFSFLQKRTVELMFLDIHMPKMTGLELIRSLHHPPRVILTTAYREYALEGFDLDVLDYLVKPISFERFMKAVSKYHQYVKIPAEDDVNDSVFNQAYLFIKVDGDQVKVFFKDILYIEGMKDYLKIITPEKTYVTYSRLKNMEKKLPEERFVRIHKSYIISTGKIQAYNSESVKIEGKELPIGRVYKQKFQDSLSDM